ncbi:type IV pilus assembly protein PilN [Fibrobacter sp. UWB15]|jgi:type IV pilus assembly protein PilN|uniref:PilN domain-containing protein n=1 Tax=unclassified Fibrobacter TaxID=2634177 RepID=UPI000916D8E2|nr:MULTISPECIES: PilN domain-containing protein [unclassified Fibrobacter]PWJ65057.1 type IV pilus assembly protein PilN [Fibrobacter sp. UWB6]SHG10254.1 type IV pilus assembly protein PilN [Fibrobacter sp. UWB8]SMG30518.1 type IV pilus assembly protein PilN [Fibrobacter sp. UWB15]
MASTKKETTRNALAISINLLPPEFRKKQKDFSWITDRRIIWPTVALLVAIVAVVMLQGYVNETISGLSTELTRVQEEVERERPLLSKISDLEQKQGIVNTKINALKSIQVSKKRWVILFENISSVLPPNMWITSINQMGEFDLEMRGVTYDFSEVAEYMVKLEKQVSIQSVSLVTISTAKVDGKEAYNFTIKIVLKRDLGEGDNG